MPKIIKEFIVIIVVLLIIVIGLVGYIVYDKILNVEDDYEISDDNNVGTTNNTTINNNSNTSLDKEYNSLFNEIKNIYDVVYDFKTTQYVYCGKSESSNHQMVDGINDNVSTQFKTYDEMYNYLKQYMSEELIKDQRYYEKNFYREENGKLYCLNAGKELSYDLGDVNISITNIENNKITVMAVQEIIPNETYYQKMKITYELVNDKYIVTSFIPIVKGIND